MSRPLRAIIDHGALINNLQRVRAAARGSAVMAVIKANAYGHGAVPVARTLTHAGADELAVISIGEAMQLREAGIDTPTTLLQGFFDPAELRLISEQRLAIVLHHPGQLAALVDAGSGLPRSLRVWVKVDTGMHRLGFHPEQIDGVLRRLSDIPMVQQPLGLFSHLASADTRDDLDAAAQISAFQQIAARYPRCHRSLANSAAVLAWPDSHAGTVRPGIMLYGSSPFVDGVDAQRLGLRAVMKLHSALISVRRMRRGDRIGYAGSWQCPEDMPVGLVAGGYGDGYPRHAPSGTPVLVGGTRVNLIGRVSMDSICVDLRSCAAAAVGDEVVLWGDDPSIDQVAQAAGTIGYEPLTQLTARVPVEHVGMPP